MSFWTIFRKSRILTKASFNRGPFLLFLLKAMNLSADFFYPELWWRHDRKETNNLTLSGNKNRQMLENNNIYFFFDSSVFQVWITLTSRFLLKLPLPLLHITKLHVKYVCWPIFSLEESHRPGTVVGRSPSKRSLLVPNEKISQLMYFTTWKECQVQTLLVRIYKHRVFLAESIRGQWFCIPEIIGQQRYFACNWES